jgi:hypothetical protein
MHPNRRPVFRSPTSAWSVVIKYHAAATFVMQRCPVGKLIIHSFGFLTFAGLLELAFTA